MRRPADSVQNVSKAHQHSAEGMLGLFPRIRRPQYHAYSSGVKVKIYGTEFPFP
jgi:hypothetical protein